MPSPCIMSVFNIIDMKKRDNDKDIDGDGGDEDDGDDGDDDVEKEKTTHRKSDKKIVKEGKRYVFHFYHTLDGTKVVGCLWFNADEIRGGKTFAWKPPMVIVLAKFTHGDDLGYKFRKVMSIDGSVESMHIAAIKEGLCDVQDSLCRTIRLGSLLVGAVLQYTNTHTIGKDPATAIPEAHCIIQHSSWNGGAARAQDVSFPSEFTQELVQKAPAKITYSGYHHPKVTRASFMGQCATQRVLTL